MMFNKITLISLLLFFLLGTNVFAHSHLADSTPKNGEVLTESLNDITLSFETAIEQTSTFTLVDSNGSAFPLTAIVPNGNQLTGKLAEDLPNGTYAIHWKIIGSDGHQLEGDIPFTVKLPESTTEQDEALETTVEDTERVTTEVTEDTKEVNEQASLPLKVASDEPSIKAYIVPGSIALIILVGFGSYWFIFRRKQI